MQSLSFMNGEALGLSSDIESALEDEVGADRCD